MMIRFGAGSSELRARVQAYQATERGLRHIAEANTSGSKMPGMAVLVAGGAVLGSSVATSAVISGEMNIAKETSGAVNLDAKRMPKTIAERATTFYLRQGWL